MEKHITVTEESVKTGLNIEADKGTRITNQVENNLGAVKNFNDDDDTDELADDENITEEKVIIDEEDDVDELDEDEDLDIDEDDEDDDEEA
jgi:hypothetical protein